MDGAEYYKVPTTNDRNNLQNGTKKEVFTARKATNDEDDYQPPDGGSRAWLVMVGSFFCNGILFGVINSYSVLYNEFYMDLRHRNVSQAASKASLVGSLAMGTTFIVSPISGILTDTIGLRTTTFLGGLIAAGGMFLSSFFTHNIEALYFTYGIMYGFGGALAYTPSLAILGHYFKKYMGVVNGVVTAGSSCFTILMPYIIDLCLKELKIVWTLRVLAFFAACIMGCALLFKPVAKKSKTKKAVTLSNSFNMSIWKNKKYVIWTTVIPLSLFGYFVPYVHMLNFVKDNFSEQHDGKLAVISIGITSGLGRLIFGYIADLPKINRIFLQQISFLFIGILTMLLPSTSGSFAWLIVITLCMGLFDGCFISLLGPIAFDICGRKGATQAIGFLLGLCSFPLTIGPYVAGRLYDTQKTYNLAFRLAGIPPILGAVAMFLIRLIKTPEEAENGDEEVRETLQNNKKVSYNNIKNSAEAKLASTESLDDHSDEQENL